MSYFYTNMANKQRNPDRQNGYTELYRNTYYDDVSLAELQYNATCEQWYIDCDYTHEPLWFDAKNKALKWLSLNNFELTK